MSKILRKHSISVIGFPQSGKTTLITAIFSEIFKKKSSKYEFFPRGSTIDKVNEDISRLDSGKKLNPTTDQDLFAYRTDLNVNKPLKINKYKVEVGDCPGEDTNQFINKYGEWLHKTPFFDWVTESDVFIFVIDLAMAFSDKIIIKTFLNQLGLRGSIFLKIILKAIETLEKCQFF